MSPRLFLLLAWLALLSPSSTSQGAQNDYLDFVRSEAARLRSNDQLPATREAWYTAKINLRKNLLEAWGGFPENPAPLQPKKLGELQRNGYRVEKIIFQTLPGLWLTANAYVPDRPGKLPAILMVHGHWHGAKQDPVVQSRCIGAARLGFFVLAVDAFGAGERAVGRALGEYHGDMTAATLLPVGLPLSGLQVYENIRAVDYLQSRPEVNPEQIGITGASGGGNQSMYAGAWDERLKAVAPVCSVGNYQAYLGAACCMCEVVPGALKFTEEWSLLAMVAPRALLVINATRDSSQFSVSESNRSLDRATSVFTAFGKPENIRHSIFESGHDYSRPMRETVYGWMTLHLKHEGNASPLPEPELTTEDPESLRCFPGDSRPDDWITIPKFAATQARHLLASRNSTTPADHSAIEKKNRQKILLDLLGGFPTSSPLNLKVIDSSDHQSRQIIFTPEPGITLTARHQFGRDNSPLTIVLDLEGAERAAASDAARQAITSGHSLITLDLRATGKLAWPQDKVGRAPDHTTAQWGLWIGRPLLGQWVYDLHLLLDALKETDSAPHTEIRITGLGPAGIVALAAAALDNRITKVTAVNSLATYVTEAPYENQRMGILVPAIFKSFGDISHIAALIYPAQLTIQNPVDAQGKNISSTTLKEIFEPAIQAYSLAPENFQLLE